MVLYCHFIIPVGNRECTNQLNYLCMKYHSDNTKGTITGKMQRLFGKHTNYDMTETHNSWRILPSIMYAPNIDDSMLKIRKSIFIRAFKILIRYCNVSTSFQKCYLLGRIGFPISNRI